MILDEEYYGYVRLQQAISNQVHYLKHFVFIFVFLSFETTIQCFFRIWNPNSILLAMMKTWTDADSSFNTMQIGSMKIYI